MREAYLGVVVGKKGVGKTYTTTQMIYDYVSGFNGKVKPKRVLILDANNEFENILPISIHDVKRFTQHPTIEARRVVPFDEYGKRLTLDGIAEYLNKILADFGGGLLLVEDINKYVADAMPKDIVGAICTVRHQSMDIILHYQGIGRVLPKVWQNANWLRFHKITEGVERHKEKYEDKYECFCILENLVNNEYRGGNQRFYAYVDLEEMKIKGITDKAKAQKAIQEYVGANLKASTRNTISLASLNDKKLTVVEAAKIKMAELLETYFDFK